MKKIDGEAARVLADILQEKDPSFEFNGQQYKIVAIDNKDDDLGTTVAEDVEKNPELKQKLLQAKKDIEEGNY